MNRRICIIVPAHWEAVMGGSQYQAKLLLERLLDRYEIEAHYLTTMTRPGFDPKGYRIVRFSDRSGIRRYGPFLDAIGLYRALRAVRPHAIIQFVGSGHTGIAAFYARCHGCQMFWRVTSDRSVLPSSAPWWKLHLHIEQLFFRYGVRHADWILAQSEFQREQLARTYRRDNVRVVPNFHPVPPDRRRGITPTRRVVWIANLKPLKNPGAFVRLARCFADRRDICFIMIGRTMHDDRWTRRLLREIRATPNIEYLGERTQDEVNHILERCDLLVNTSDYEGFSNTFIQAWMRRVPVVSLNVDPDALLAEGGLGVLSRTEQQLERDVSRLLSSASVRAAIGARCREYALRRHTEANVDEIAALLSIAVTEPAAEVIEDIRMAASE